MDQRVVRSAKDKPGAADLECGLIAVLLAVVLIAGLSAFGAKPNTMSESSIAAQP
jgi:Flp pilus assembly pilin Flp